MAAPLLTPREPRGARPADEATGGVLEPFKRLWKAGVVEVGLENGAIEVPDGIGAFLEGSERAYEETQAGLQIS